MPIGYGCPMQTCSNYILIAKNDKFFDLESKESSAFKLFDFILI